MMRIVIIQVHDDPVIHLEVDEVVLLRFSSSVDRMDGENIPDGEIAAAVRVGASVTKHWSTVSSIAVVWSD